MAKSRGSLCSLFLSFVLLLSNSILYSTEPPSDSQRNVTVPFNSLAVRDNYGQAIGHVAPGGSVTQNLVIHTKRVVIGDTNPLPTVREVTQLATFQPTYMNCNGGVFPKSLDTQGKVFVNRTREDGKSYLQSIFQNLFGLLESKTLTSKCVTLCALDGMGGIGKTTLAVEYAWKYGKYYDAIFWIDASSEGTLKRSYISLLKELSEGKLADSDLQQKTKDELTVEVVHKLSKSSCKHWLLICDNAEKYEDVEDLASQSSGHVLCTSRHNEWCNKIDVGLLKEEEAIELLYRVSHLELGEENSVYAKQLVNDRLGNLALAITQAGSYIHQSHIRKRGISFRDYIDCFDDASRRLELMEHRLPDAVTSYKGDDSRKRAVMTTWQVTIDKLGEDAKRLVSYFSYLSPDMIPVSLFYGDKRKKVEEAIDDFVLYSMVNREKEYLSVHRLVQLVGRSRYEDFREDSPNLYVGSLLKSLLELWKQHLQNENQKYGIESFQLVLAVFNKREAEISEKDIIEFNQRSFFHLLHVWTLDEHVSRLRNGSLLEDRYYFPIKVLLNALEPDLRDTISETSTFLLSRIYPSKNNIQRSSLIQTLALDLSIGFEDCMQLVQAASPLLSPTMNGISCGYILRVLIRMNKREQVVCIVSERLKSEDMDGKDIAILLKAVSLISDTDLDNFVRECEVIKGMQYERRLPHIRDLVRRFAGVKALFELLRECSTNCVSV